MYVLISNPLKIATNFMRKSPNKIENFFTFIIMSKSFRPMTFLSRLLAIFYPYSNSESSFAFFDTQVKFLQNKFWAHISTFFQTLKPKSKETAQKSKNLCYI
jgi:hypothetical protein